MSEEFKEKLLQKIESIYGMNRYELGLDKKSLDDLLIIENRLEQVR